MPTYLSLLVASLMYGAGDASPSLADHKVVDSAPSQEGPGSALALGLPCEQTGAARTARRAVPTVNPRDTEELNAVGTVTLSTTIPGIRSDDASSP